MKFETAVLTWFTKIMRKDTNSAYNPDLHSNEAIRGAIDSLNVSGSVNVTTVGGTAVSGPNDLKADVSGLATAAELATHDGKLDVVDGYHDVPALDTTANAQMRDVIGRKDDSPAYGVQAVKSLMAYVKGIVNMVLAQAKDSMSNLYVKDIIGNKEDTAVTDIVTNRSLMNYVKGILWRTANMVTDLTAVKAQTDQLSYSGGSVQARVADKGVLNDLSSADAATACASALTAYDPPTKSEMDSGFAALNNLSQAQAQTAAANALSAYDPPTKTEQDAAFTEIKGAGWSTETLKAIKDAIDAIETGGESGGGYDPTTRAFTLNENINAGDLVRIINNSGGKVAKVPAGLAKSAERQLSQANDLSACQISDTKILLVYPGYATNYGTAQLVEIQGKSVAVGTPHVFKSSACSYIRAAYDPENNCLAIFYNWNSSGFILPGSINGLGIAFVPSSETGAGYYQYIATFVPSQKSFVLLYNTGSTQMTAVACQINTSTWVVTKGTDISCGWVGSVTPDFMSGCYCTQSDRLYYAYIYQSYYLYDTVVSVSGVTLTVQRSFTLIYNAYSTQPQCIRVYEDPVTKYVLLAYSGYWNYAYNCQVMVINVSPGGSSIQSYGSVGYAGTNAYPYSIRITRDPRSGGSCVLTLKGDNGYGYYRDFTVAANGTITWGASAAVYKSASLSIQECFPLRAPYGVAILCRASGDSYAYCINIYPSAMDAIGFLQETGTAGQSKNVKLIVFPGGLSEGHSGLIPGQRYYISSAAILVSTEGFLVGYAIDTNKLLITNNDFNSGASLL